MSIEIRIPDIGDADGVGVIEVLIKAGDVIEADQSVVVLESDKSSMEVPADVSGTVESVVMKVGDQVKQGDVVAIVSAGGAAQAVPAQEKPAEASAPASSGGALLEMKVPDIGDDDGVAVIEISVNVGDVIEKEQTLITLESDKASMEVPTEFAGKVMTLALKVGDKVSTGTVIGTIQTTDAAAPVSTPVPAAEKAAAPAAQAPTQPAKASAPPAVVDQAAFDKAYASPSVRRFARELGADLGKVSGTGRKGRVLAEDVKAWVKQALSGAGKTGDQTVVSGIPPIPAVDFSKFGEVEEHKLSRINVLTGEAMTRCWLNIPHVTQHDQCDITDLEDFRKSLKAEAEKQGVRVTMLAFLMKALASGLQAFPRFNSSLSPDGKSLIMKKYINIGIAVDTPNGLVVPVIRDIDKKGIYALSADLMEISKKARDGKLTPRDMSGASMTISSLGGIGGQYFTPIVNAPEVAILGVSRSSIQPVWDGKAFQPRLMLPLSLSYDHRVIDGALGARMTVYLGQVLGDMRRSLL